MRQLKLSLGTLKEHQYWKHCCMDKQNITHLIQCSFVIIQQHQLLLEIDASNTELEVFCPLCICHHMPTATQFKKEALEANILFQYRWFYQHPDALLR